MISKEFKPFHPWLNEVLFWENQCSFTQQIIAVPTTPPNTHSLLVSLAQNGVKQLLLDFWASDNKK